MEVNAVLFIGTLIAGITQFIKAVFPKVISGEYTIVVALVVGILVAIIDTQIGVPDVTIAQGLMIAFGAVGVVGTVERIG
jgi:hypothetical protein